MKKKKWIKPQPPQPINTKIKGKLLGDGEFTNNSIDYGNSQIRYLPLQNQISMIQVLEMYRKHIDAEGRR